MPLVAESIPEPASECGSDSAEDDADITPKPWYERLSKRENQTSATAKRVLRSIGARTASFVPTSPKYQASPSSVAASDHGRQVWCSVHVDSTS